MDSTRQSVTAAEAMEALVEEDVAANPFSVAARREAKHWYYCFKGIAFQSPLPMVTTDLSWDNLPEWYQDLLTSAMEQYLKTGR